MPNTQKILYKAREMEELLDLWFYHPLGFVIAKFAFKFRLLPDHVSYISMGLGIAGGLMLSSYNSAVWGWCVLVFASVLDSADGQLARMQGGGTLKGRIIDGMIGYAMFTSSYVGLFFLYMSGPQNRGALYMLAMAVGGGMISAFQSSMYDYYRTQFSSIIGKGRIEIIEKSREDPGKFLGFMYSGYQSYQKFFASSNVRLAKFLAKRYGAELPQKIRDEYKSSNIIIIRGWNLLGDNTRLLAILACVILKKPDWYFIFVSAALSMVMLALILIQRVIDRRLMQKL
ncbi:MAG: CDP-alcohol phosphatidyltransferase family protein, partial [Elusimicrobia bacterium]|nr:CDP-alcohol phosphatidyltransferase family protein [Elusimicrobiota bacterium]